LETGCESVRSSKNYLDWNNYQKLHIMLSTDFVALDTKSNSITKAACLKKFPEVNQLVGNYKD